MGKWENTDRWGMCRAKTGTKARKRSVRDILIWSINRVKNERLFWLAIHLIGQDGHG